MIVFGICGPQRAGKSTAAAHLETRWGACRFGNSALLRRILEVIGRAVTRPELTALGEALFHAFGRDVLAQAHIAAIRQRDIRPSVVVVDGIRFIEEVERYRSEFGSAFHLMFVDAPLDTRYVRARIANDPDKPGEAGLTRAEFIRLSHYLTESFVDRLQVAANVVIRNDGPVSEFLTQLDAVVTGVGEGRTSPSEREQG